MRKDLLLFLPLFFFLALTSFGRGGTVEYEYLAYSHKTLPIERLYFLNRNLALGIGEENKDKSTPIYLLDKHNLVQDTFISNGNPINVIVSNDSTVFLQESTKTLELLVRNNKILLRNQLTIEDKDPGNPVKVLKDPLFLCDHVLGKSYPSIKEFRRKDYSLQMLPVNHERKVCNQVCPKTVMNSKGSPKNHGKDIEYALEGSKLYVFQNSGCRLIQINLEDEEVQEAIDLEEEDWNFYLDHIQGRKYLTKKAKGSEKGFDLFLLDSENHLKFQETLETEPFGIVDNRIHTIKKKKDQYFHHLIPLSSEDGFEKNNLLEEVQILAH